MLLGADSRDKLCPGGELGPVCPGYLFTASIFLASLPNCVAMFMQLLLVAVATGLTDFWDEQWEVSVPMELSSAKVKDLTARRVLPNGYRAVSRWRGVTHQCLILSK